MRKLLILTAVAVFVWGYALASYRILVCNIKDQGKGTKVSILMSSQFVREVFKVLSEGEDYDVVVMVKAGGKVYRFKKVFSYDVVNRVFTIDDGKHEEKIKNPTSFKIRVRRFSVYIPCVSKEIKVRVEHRGISLPFPFNIFYSSSYKTDWCKCK